MSGLDGIAKVGSGAPVTCVRCSHQFQRTSSCPRCGTPVVPAVAYPPTPPISDKTSLHRVTQPEAPSPVNAVMRSAGPAVPAAMAPAVPLPPAQPAVSVPPVPAPPAPPLAVNAAQRPAPDPYAVPAPAPAPTPAVATKSGLGTFDKIHNGLYMVKCVIVGGVATFGGVIGLAAGGKTLFAGLIALAYGVWILSGLVTGGWRLFIY